MAKGPQRDHLALLEKLDQKENRESLAPPSRSQVLLVLKETRELLVGLELRDLKEPKEKRDKTELGSLG